MVAHLALIIAIFWLAVAAPSGGGEPTENPACFDVTVAVNAVFESAFNGRSHLTGEAIAALHIAEDAVCGAAERNLP